jgi:hypothetical protein
MCTFLLKTKKLFDKGQNTNLNGKPYDHICNSKQVTSVVMHLAYAWRMMSLNLYHGTSYTDFGNEIKVKLTLWFIIKPS